MQHESDKSDLTFPTDLIAFVFGIGLFCHSLFILNQNFLQDPDTYWHIETGRWIWLEQKFPRSDIFSHTAFGQPWTNMEWLSQIILYFSYEALGWHGLVLLAGLTLTLTFVTMYLLLARNLRATVALGATTVAYIFASNHFLARPHLLSYPVIVLWVAFLARACDENRRPSFWLLPLVHVVGEPARRIYVWLGAGGRVCIRVYRYCASAADRRRVATEWSIFWICALLAGCITPYGYQYIVETYNVLNLGLVLQQNSEWRPMNADNEFAHEIILLILLTLALSYGVKIRFPRTLLLVGILHLGLKHVRGLPMIGLTWPFLLARPLQTQYAFLRPSNDPWPLFGARTSGPLPALLCAAATAIAMVVLSAVYIQVRQPTPSSNVSPQAAVDYVLAQNVTGPVLNDFDFGGYLIFRGIKTFIDGRTLPFGKKFAVEYFEAMSPEKLSKLDEMADTYKVTWTLLRPGTPMANYFDHSPHWRQLYTDKIAVVHVRR